jgi:hypothetical protein
MPPTLSMSCVEKALTRMQGISKVTKISLKDDAIKAKEKDGRTKSVSYFDNQTSFKSLGETWDGQLIVAHEKCAKDSDRLVMVFYPIKTKSGEYMGTSSTGLARDAKRYMQSVQEHLARECKTDAFLKLHEEKYWTSTCAAPEER